MSASEASTDRVVLFDGVCNLCNGVVQFLIDHDPKAKLRFASLQSEAGRKLLLEHGMKAPEGDPDSIVFVVGGRAYAHSTAVLRIALALGGLWSVLAVGYVLPRFLRDALYRFIARHRYSWFGREESCRVPTPELRARFLA